MISLIISLMLMFNPGTKTEADVDKQAADMDTCWVYADIQSHAGMDVICAGKIIEYIPLGDGSKLGDEKIWDYELKTQDGYKVPLSKMPSVDIENFKGKDVFIKANIKYGIIFGSENTANITG
ncbi:MAG: hypothetical protein ABI543_14980, partial [Ignavibacteria bacterium]